jgi:CheY-like chemotaxis protein
VEGVDLPRERSIVKFCLHSSPYLTWLPEDDMANQRQRHNPDRHAPRSCSGLRVLIVEDDPHLATDMAVWLSCHGHKARVATDGPAALRTAEDDPPDVMLLDIGLPGMDGFEVAERVRVELAPAMPKVPLLIAVTGRGEEDLLRSRRAGIHLHLTKPVDVEELSRLLGRFQDIIG